MIRLSVILFTLITAVSQAQENRSITGFGNNLADPALGATHTALIQKTTPNFADGIGAMDDVDRPQPRLISNKLFDQNSPVINNDNLSDFVWLFGQFIDHDISLVESDRGQQPQRLEIPVDDEFFEEDAVIEFFRDMEMEDTGVPGVPRKFRNEITAFIDGSMIYGSDQERADWLRTFEDGKLWVSKNESIGAGDLLPWNTSNKEYGGEGTVIDNNAPAMASGGNSKYFVCGDVRANENPLLLAMHTLFLREHNRLCDEIKQSFPSWNDEQLYQRARKMIGAYLQNITFEEWLPSVGVHLPAYNGYVPELEPGIFNVFSAAAFRIGHTMIDSDIIRMSNDGEVIPAGNLTLQEGFFEPIEILYAQGIEPYFKGMGTQVMQEMDCKMIHDLRNFLFDGENRGLDLASLNVFRGRDRGLGDFNTLRVEFGLAPLNAFEHLTDSSEDVDVMRELYKGDINKIDAWVGMLSEQHVSEDAIFGELVMTILSEQFSLLRDGDRFYFENDPAFTEEQIASIKNTTLHDILMRNTDIDLMQSNLFKAMPHSDIPNIPLVENVLANKVYPNPVIDQALIKIYSDQERPYSYRLVNNQGIDLQSGASILKPGDSNYLELKMEEYSNGIYYLLLESGDDFEVTKIVK